MSKNSRARHALRWTGTVVAALVVGLIITAAVIDWNDLRGPISRIVSARLDRPVRIAGDLDVQLFSLTPRVSMTRLELGNLPWAGPGSKATVDGLDVQMRLLPPYRFVLKAASRDTRIDAHGTAAAPFALGSYRGGVTVTGRDLADLYYLTGLVTPNTPPYKISGDLRRTGQQLMLRNVIGRMGDSDIRGNITVNFGGARPHVAANLASYSLNLVDLAPAFGAPPDPANKTDRLFPDTPLQMSRLRAMDAQLVFRAVAIKTRKLPLRELALNLQLNDGVLHADPVAFTLPQGALSGSVHLDARGKIPSTQIDARVTGVKLEQFRPRNGNPPPFEGVLRARAKLSGEGGSVHDFISTADGNMTVIVPKGEVREAFAELTGINVARGLGLLITKDQEHTGVRCGVADFALRNGTLHARNIVFDTDDVLIDGEGEIDLTAETFDLSIQGHPKKLRLLRVQSPIAIRGPLRKPDVGLESGDAVKQTGIAAALAAIAAPLAAVVAFVDPGLAEDADCGALLAQAKKKGAPVKTAEIVKAKSR